MQRVKDNVVSTKRYSYTLVSVVIRIFLVWNPLRYHDILHVNYVLQLIAAAPVSYCH